MAEQGWKRKEYETWDEAFRGCAPAVRQQSVRVAAYTQALFIRAVADGFGRDTEAGAQRMVGQYADLSYKCGMYHQLGKALVPPEYQLWRNDFTDEEIAVYRKYTTDGHALVSTLQERGERAREKRTGLLKMAETAAPIENIPWLMLQESCQQHMERWDGTGYPDGRKGDDISPIAQIVGLAKELDRLASEIKSETPFDEAMDALYAGSGAAWNPALIDVLRNCRDKCAAVYEKYIHYSMTIPKTVPLVDKRQERPMGLHYRPMAGNDTAAIVAYEAIPWFGGIAGRPGETEDMDDLADMLRRTELTVDITFYLLYEAADALLRIQNCRLALQGILLPLLPDFFRAGSQLTRLEELFERQPVSKDKLWLAVPADFVAAAGKGVYATLERYLRNGYTLVLDGYDPGQISPERVKELGFTHVRCKRELYLQQETANVMTALCREGITLLGVGADSTDVMKWLAACGVTAMSGPLTGVPVDEDEMIRDSLLRERH